MLHDGAADEGEVASAIESRGPTGWTPLADGIEQAGEDLPEEATDGIVYVVTDGLESCGGDPVQAAQDLPDSGIRPVVNGIGFQVGDADQEAAGHRRRRPGHLHARGERRGAGELLARARTTSG